MALHPRVIYKGKRKTEELVVVVFEFTRDQIVIRIFPRLSILLCRVKVSDQLVRGSGSDRVITHFLLSSSRNLVSSHLGLTLIFYVDVLSRPTGSPTG